MPNPKVRTLTIGGVTYDLQDNVSGYITGITSSDVTTALGFTPYNATNPSGYTSNTGTVTKVIAGTGLAIGSTAQGNFTTSGTINHTNSVTAQTTQAIYPIKIDAQGHISAYGTAVTPLTAASTLDATKLSGTIPSSCYTDTNNAVTQTATITDANYEILFSATADNTTRTEGAQKTSTLTYNPSTKKLTTGAIYATATGGSSRSYIDQKTNKLSLLVNDDDEYSNSEITVESGQITFGFNTNKFLTAQQNDNTGVISVVLTNLVTPTNDTDAANKKYVDDKRTQTTATLTTTWSSNQQTVTVSGVTTSNTVVVTPAPASYDAYCEAGIYCSAQASNSLTFKCSTVPTSSLTVNIMILK